MGLTGVNGLEPHEILSNHKQRASPNVVHIEPRLAIEIAAVVDLQKVGEEAIGERSIRLWVYDPDLIIETEPTS